MPMPDIHQMMAANGAYSPLNLNLLNFSKPPPNAPQLSPLSLQTSPTIMSYVPQNNQSPQQVRVNNLESQAKFNFSQRSTPMSLLNHMSQVPQMPSKVPLMIPTQITKLGMEQTTPKRSPPAYPMPTPTGNKVALSPPVTNANSLLINKISPSTLCTNDTLSKSIFTRGDDSQIKSPFFDNGDSTPTGPFIGATSNVPHMPNPIYPYSPFMPMAPSFAPPIPKLNSSVIISSNPANLGISELTSASGITMPLMMNSTDMLAEFKAFKEGSRSSDHYKEGEKPRPAHQNYTKVQKNSTAIDHQLALQTAQTLASIPPMYSSPMHGMNIVFPYDFSYSNKTHTNSHHY